jgi:flagellar hook-associated protein 2
MVDAPGSTTNSSTTSSSTRPKVNGLISGIQSSDIIDAFINADRATTRLLERNKALYEARREAVRTFNTRMLSAQLDLGTLKRASTFQSRTTTSSNTDALAITTTASSAVPGTYTLDVVQVARAHQLATVGQASAETAFASGTLSLQVGDAAASEITFSAGGSLTDVAAAINNAGTGITASVINDGSGSPFRLVLNGGKTGAANDILVSGTGGMASLFTGMSTLAAATDAQVRIGSGGGAITVTQASNTFSEIVPGVTLEARNVANGITIGVTADPTAAKDGIKKFVESYNAATTYLKANAGFDPATKTAGVLISQANLVAGMGQITRALTGSISGLPSSLNSLAAIGITLNRTDGTLVVDQTKLDRALVDNAEGVRKLFMNTGTSTEPSVQFSNLTDKTKVAGPFTVNITQPAVQAVLSSTDLAASTVISNSNNTLGMSVNGRPVTLTLTNGTYTRAELATQLQSSFNAVLSPTNEKLVVSLTGNRLDIHSERYGRTQNIQIRSDSTALTALGLNPQNVTGIDVAGTINGVAGAGNGRLLGGAVGSDAEGLSLNVTASVALSGASVTAHKGIGQLIGERFTRLTDNSIGTISSIDKNLSKNITDATSQITKADLTLTKRRERYERQFQSMERMIAQFNSQGTAMTNFVNSLTPREA